MWYNIYGCGVSHWTISFHIWGWGYRFLRFFMVSFFMAKRKAAPKDGLSPSKRLMFPPRCLPTLAQFVSKCHKALATMPAITARAKRIRDLRKPNHPLSGGKPKKIIALICFLCYTFSRDKTQPSPKRDELRAEQRSLPQGRLFCLWKNEKPPRRTAFLPLRGW